MADDEQNETTEETPDETPEAEAAPAKKPTTRRKKADD